MTPTTLTPTEIQRKQHIEEVNERYTLAGMPSPTKDPEAT
jgi:hypothetical protein